MAVLILLICIAFIAVYIFAAIEFGKVTEEKGYADRKNKVIALCIIFPIAGYLLACALPDKKGRNRAESNTNIFDELPDL